PPLLEQSPEQAAVGAESGATSPRDARQAEPGKVDGGDRRVQTLGQRGRAGLPADRVPTETVDEQHTSTADRSRAVAPLHGVHPEAVDVEPLFLPAIGHRSRSSPSAASRSSCSSIQTVWYESTRGDVNQSCSPSTTRRRADRSRSRYGAKWGTEPPSRRSRGPARSSTAVRRSITD